MTMLRNISINSRAQFQAHLNFTEILAIDKLFIINALP